MDYVIKSGDTLSGIAQRNGVSIQTILGANPSITNPNVIKAGASLKIPTVAATPVNTIQNTTAQRAADIKTQNDYNSIVQGIPGYGGRFADGSGFDQYGNPVAAPSVTPTNTGNNNNGGTITTGNPTITPAKLPDNQDPTSAISNLYINGTTDPGAIYTELSKTIPGITNDQITTALTKLKADPNTFQTASTNSAIKQQMSDLDKNQANFDIELEKMKANLTAENLAAVESIKANSAKARQLLKDSYATNKANQEKVGYATNSFRYTPSQTENLLTKEEQDFTVNMAALDAQEKGLLLQAAQAKSKGDWDLLQKQVDQFNKTQNDKRDLIAKMITTSTNYLKQIQTETKAKTDAADKAAKEAPTKAKASAPAILAAMTSMPDQASKDAYVEQKAKELGVSIDVLNSALHNEMAAQDKANKGNDLLSAAEAKTLGVPYGTTRDQAAAMGIVPTTPTKGVKITTYDTDSNGVVYKVTMQDGKEISRIEQKTTDTVPQSDIDSAGSQLQARTGRAKGDPNGDQYVSPEDYNTGLQNWVAAGYSANSYYKNFKKFVNPAHPEDYNHYPKAQGVADSPVSLNNQPGNALASAVMKKYPQGTVGPTVGNLVGQCAVFVQKVTDVPTMGDTTATKHAMINREVKNGNALLASQWRKDPQVGDVVVFNYNHTAMVNAVHDGKVTFSEANYNEDGKVTHTRTIPINDPSIYGAYRGNVKIKIQTA